MGLPKFVDVRKTAWLSQILRLHVSGRSPVFAPVTVSVTVMTTTEHAVFIKPLSFFTG